MSGFRDPLTFGSADEASGILLAGVLALQLLGWFTPLPNQIPMTRLSSQHAGLGGLNPTLECYTCI